MHARHLRFSPWLALVALSLPASALAEKGGNLDLNAFHHAVDSRGFITANASQILAHLDVSFGLVTNWGFKVLEFEGDNCQNTVNNSQSCSYEVTHVVSPTLQ